MWSYCTKRQKRQYNFQNKGRVSLRLANFLLPLVLYSCLKTLMFCSAMHPLSWYHFLRLHTPLTFSHSSSWLGLWSVVWKALTPWCSTGRESQCDGTECLANTHCEAGACGGLYGPSDVENRETDPPLTTALCIQTHPRRETLPVMATCPIYTQTWMRTHRESCMHTHTQTSMLNLVLTFSIDVPLLPSHKRTHRALVHDNRASDTWDCCGASYSWGPAFISLCDRGTDVHPHNGSAV